MAANQEHLKGSSKRMNALMAKPRAILLAAAPALLLAVAGCDSLQQVLQQDPPHPAWLASNNTASKQVKVGGDSLQLGDVTKPNMTPDAFARRIYELTAEQKYVTAQNVVLRYPDVALEIFAIPQVSLRLTSPCNISPAFTIRNAATSILATVGPPCSRTGPTTPNGMPAMMPPASVC